MQREKELVLLRHKVSNQVLIKNYNLSTFISEMDQTVQDTMAYMNEQKPDEVLHRGCFNAYLLDYLWKLIQVKISLMVQQLNWKVCNEKRVYQTKFEQKLKIQQARHELQLKELHEKIEAQEKKIDEQKQVIEMQ